MDTTLIWETSTLSFTTGEDIMNSTSEVFINITSTDISMANISNATARTSVFKPFYPLLATEMVMSIICLVATIVVYTILPDFKNLHGKDMISLCSCLLTTYALLLVDFMFRGYLPPSFCMVSGVIVQATFLATFLWTQIMAYDICKKLTNLRTKKNEVTPNSSKTYYKHSLYAWTATLVITLGAVVLDNTTWIPKAYKPQFGHIRCWLNGQTAFLIYFNAPVGIILFSNMIMFALTSWYLYKAKNMAQKTLDRQAQKRFHLYLKLFVAMGLTWFIEFLPWITGIRKLYALAGIVTCLHGIILFAIFILKRRVLMQVQDKMKTFINTKIRPKKVVCNGQAE